MEYLIWLASFVWFPTLILWFLFPKLLWRYRITLFHAAIFALIFSVPWDILATKTNIWQFPKESNIGIYIGGLPLEEYLFMVFVTILISSVTIVAKYKLK